MTSLRLARNLLIAAAAAMQAGCATYYTKAIQSNPAPYSGTALDLRVQAHYWSLGHAPCGLPSCSQSWVLMADLPFSFVADTLLIPLYIADQSAVAAAN